MRIEVYAENDCKPRQDVFRVSFEDNAGGHAGSVTLESISDNAISFDRSYIPGIVDALKKAYDLTKEEVPF